MNKIDRVKELVFPEYDKLDCWIHKWQHIEEVVENSDKITKLERLEDYAESCIIASYCHDLGRIEEERRKKDGKKSFPHALLSIEPTVKILQKTGISEIAFDEIVEAVAVHSYKDYFGKNIVAQILRDADKLAGVYSGTVCAVRDFVGKDYIDSREIIRNWKNKDKIREFSKYTLEHLETDDETLKKIIKQLDWIIEYKDMFHTKSALFYAKEGIEYMKEYKNFLTQKLISK